MARKKKVITPVEEVVKETTPEAEVIETVVETEMTAERVETEVTAERVETEMTAERVETEMTAERVETEMTAERVETVVETEVDTTVEPDSFDEWWNTEGVAAIRRGVSTKRLLVAACAAGNDGTYTDLITSEAAQEVLATNKNDVRALAEIGFNL